MFSPTRARRGAHHAFTLIELLVVIAIIAILAAILFPVFAQAREKARATACLSNTKQLALGVMQYTQDFDELLPVAGYNAQLRGRWQWQLYPYVKNQQIFTCPNLSSNPWNAGTTNVAGVGALGQNDRGGYGWSYALQADGAGLANLDRAPGYALARIAKPADTIIIGDTGFTGTSSQAAGWAMLACDPRTAMAQGFGQPGLLPQFRHNQGKTVAVSGGFQLPVEGRANFVFLDSHAKSLNIGTAMQAAASEDGNALVVETAPNHTNNNTQYLLWNIF